MKTIFIPMFGRINTNSRDGGEVRTNKLIRFLSKDTALEIFCPARQLLVSRDQGIDLTEFRTTFILDSSSSESDATMNLIAIYAFRFIKILLHKYPSNIDTIYIPSDFIFDTVPAFLCWLKNRRAKVVSCCFLICPNPFIRFSDLNTRRYSFPALRQTVYYLTQIASLKLIRQMNGTVLVLNDADYIELKKKGLEPLKTSMGIDLKQYEAIQIEHKSRDAIFVGRLHEQKGIERLLRSWKIVCDTEKRSLCIIGGGSTHYRSRLEMLIKELGIGRQVEIIGFIDGVDKIAAYKSSRVAVIPSIYESFGTTVIEAGICGLPVVAYDIPIFRELFSEYLIFSEEGDERDFAEKVLRALNTDTTVLSQKFFQYCATLDWEIIFAKEFKELAS